MENEGHSRNYNLANVLTQLSSCGDKDSYLELWNFLFDWSYRPNSDVGRVLILRSSANLTDPGSLQLFADLENDLKALRGIMHGALMPPTHSD